MYLQQIDQILKDTAYVRTGGSAEELKCAKYLRKKCAEMGAEAYLDPFEVDMADIQEARLLIDGKEITCKGYYCAGNAEIEAPVYYMPNTDPFSLKQCEGKIVMIDGGMGYWIYQDLLENGAIGFITYTGDVNHTDSDIDQKELRSYVSKGNKIPGVNINVRDAVAIVENGAKSARIVLKQDEYKGVSNNVILDLPGETEEFVLFTAHYDSTSLSTGAYDNMSGSIALLAIAEHFLAKPHRYGLRFIWCGSEERGLLGAKAYCEANEEELKKCVLDINLDMLGSTMGKWVATCTAEEKLVHFIEYLASEYGMGIEARMDIRSSDSTPISDKGVPSVNFFRAASGSIAPIHNRYDTLKVMSAERIKTDTDFIIAFTEHMVNARHFPVAREIPDSMKEKIDVYLCRKREADKKK